MLVQARDARAAVLGTRARHPDYADVLSNLAVFGSDLGSHAEAEAQCRQALEIWARLTARTTRATPASEQPGGARRRPGPARRGVGPAGAGQGHRRPAHRPGLRDQPEGQRVAYLAQVRGHWGCPCRCPAGLRRFPRDPPTSLACRRSARPRPWPPSAMPRSAASTPPGTPLAGTARPGRRSPRKPWPGPGRKVPGPPLTLDEWQARKERLEAELARQIPEMNLERSSAPPTAGPWPWACPRASPWSSSSASTSSTSRPCRPGASSNGSRPATWPSSCPPASPDDVRMIDLGEAGPIDRMIADFRAGITGEAGDRPDRDVTAPASGGPGRPAAGGRPAGGRLRPAGAGPRRPRAAAAGPRRRPDPAALRGAARRPTAAA